MMLNGLRIHSIVCDNHCQGAHRIVKKLRHEYYGADTVKARNFGVLENITVAARHTYGTDRAATFSQSYEICSMNWCQGPSQEKGIPYISPSNDWDIIAGQGALGYELYQDLPAMEVLFVAVGGGGIIGGMAAYLKSVKPNIKIIGCETDQSNIMSESLKVGKIIEMPYRETLSDGTSGGVEQGAITFDLCKRVVDQWVVVTEEEISRAIYNVMEHHCKIIEGSAGLAVAGYIKTMDQHVGKTVAILSCGSNISIEKIKKIIITHG